MSKIQIVIDRNDNKLGVKIPTDSSSLLLDKYYNPDESLLGECLEYTWGWEDDDDDYYRSRYVSLGTGIDATIKRVEELFGKEYDIITIDEEEDDDCDEDGEAVPHIKLEYGVESRTNKPTCKITLYLPAAVENESVCLDSRYRSTRQLFGYTLSSLWGYQHDNNYRTAYICLCKSDINTLKKEVHSQVQYITRTLKSVVAENEKLLSELPHTTTIILDI